MAQQSVTIKKANEESSEKQKKSRNKLYEYIACPHIL